jgi:hypothetical protein
MSASIRVGRPVPGAGLPSSESRNLRRPARPPPSPPATASGGRPDTHGVTRGVRGLRRGWGDHPAVPSNLPFAMERSAELGETMTSRSSRRICGSPSQHGSSRPTRRTSRSCAKTRCTAGRGSPWSRFGSGSGTAEYWTATTRSGMTSRIVQSVRFSSSVSALGWAHHQPVECPDRDVRAAQALRQKEHGRAARCGGRRLLDGLPRREVHRSVRQPAEPIRWPVCRREQDSGVLRDECETVTKTRGRLLRHKRCKHGGGVRATTG